MSRTFVFLTGGLGNQLFQLATGLSRERSQLILDWKLGNPRLNKSGNPDITDFQLPNGVQTRSRYKRNKIYSKISGYLLREGLEPTRIEKLLGIGKITAYMLGKLLFFRYRHVVKVVQATDNGFFEIDDVSENEFLIGYFQSFHWANLSLVEERLHAINLIEPSSELLGFLQEIRNVETVMIHVRLGDYKYHENFGIPSHEYYEAAMNELLKLRKIEKILLFSNESDLALSYIPVQWHELIYTVPDFSGSSAETLEAMRHAKNYIIGNSTLSWWGAKLSYTKNAHVFAPQPWFKSSPEPTDLIPPKWNRKDAFYK